MDYLYTIFLNEVPEQQNWYWSEYERYKYIYESILYTHMFALRLYTLHTIRVYRKKRVQGGEETEIILSSKYKYFGML